MKKRKIKWRNVCYMLIILILSIIFIVSLGKVIFNIRDKKANEKLTKEINSLVVTEEINVVNKEVIDKEENLDSDSLSNTIDYYYDYLKVPSLEVDYEKLKSINSDVAGWLQVVGASLDYPYVQTTDNKYYLYHSFDKTKNDYGWIFLDYRNQKEEIDKNTILYAHGGNQSTMFGLLKKTYDKKDWYNNSDNHYIKISNEKYNLVYQVFSLYVIPTTSDYLVINFETNNDFNEFINKIKNRSYYDFKTEVTDNDKIVTLSTCYNKKEKLVMHGKLIKQETK